MSSQSHLFEKYDVPAPRYTSYPTVPYWSDSPTTAQWTHELQLGLKKGLNEDDGSWSLYIHVPFCESLCTFCGCNTTITRDHKRESPYVDRLLREFEAYLEAVPELRTARLANVHLGGGTPTFLSAPELDRLITGLFFDASATDGRKRLNLRDGFEGSIEIDPRRTEPEQLEVLRRHGFSRVSLGVQDFDPEVQRLVNRIQPFERTQAITEAARRLGYTSVNFDLIYGLPKQTLETTRNMVARTIELRPDRIALYSFALVPWIKPAQRLFKDEDLPAGAEKRALYELAREELISAGYIEIGMDHFALPSDGLALAVGAGSLHRNFMGYSDVRTDVLLGLGVSAISEAPGCFHQNEKVLPVYESTVDEGKIPTLRGHILSNEDRTRREQILRLMTRFEVELESDEQVADIRSFLSELFED
ncbi:MAG: oxygen-independent coproporphyrinogen III oxidase, partial [Bdellovibrionales bacterium]|nr:oxygen-independent coproporphyrinogen III oxidase [Bdellovibrionales bacterium]